MNAAWTLAERGIRIGTASWTDRTLIASKRFYPRGVSSAEDRLRFYAAEFPLVEVDSTYYSLPAERNGELWAERTPEGFVFNIKAFSLFTRHPTNARALPPDLRDALADKTNLYPDDIPDEIADEIWTRFTSALQPLKAAGKLGSILLQFPKWFTPTRASRDHILRCADRIEAGLGVPAAVEFRSAGWMREGADRERTLSFLEQHGLPYVCVDMPQGLVNSVPPVVATTAPLAVVRFHGRRTETWNERGAGVHERFRYEYSEDELAGWVPGLGSLAAEAREVHVLMNNCYEDYAVRAARAMTQLLLDV